MHHRKQLEQDVLLIDVQLNSCKLISQIGYLQISDQEW